MAVNYLKELRGFYDYSMYNGVSTGEVALWYTLMAINNRLGWLDEFAVNNSILQQLTALSKSGLDYARNGLKQRGLIDYVPGKGNRPGKYRMISFDGNISDAVLDTIPDIVRTQNLALSGHNTGPLYNKVLTKHKQKHKRGDPPCIPPSAPAQKYGEYQNVLLSDDDLEKLKAEFPSDWEAKINRLSEYIASTGKKYKNHLATIRAWARRDVENPAQPVKPSKVGWYGEKSWETSYDIEEFERRGLMVPDWREEEKNREN